MKKLFSLFFLFASSPCLHAFGVIPDKDSAEYYSKMGANEDASRKYNDAWRYYEKATRFDPSNATTFLRMAEVCFLIRKNAAGIAALEAASALLPEDYLLRWRLIRIYYDYGYYAKVIELLPPLRAHFSETPAWAFMLGKSYYFLPSPDYDKAIDYLKRSLKESQPKAEAAYLIARILVTMENDAEAVPFFELSISLDTIPQPTHIYDLALILFNAGKSKEAVPYFKKAKESGYPVNDAFERNYATVLADAEHAEEAIMILEKLLVRQERNVGIIQTLADICYASGRYKKAISYGEKLLEINQKDARALYQIGSCYIKLGNEKLGRALCDKAIEMDPKLIILRQKKELF